MSIVIIGGNECMECQYREICKKYGYKPKIFVKEKASIKAKFGEPDLVVLFTDTVSHKMVNSSLSISKKKEDTRYKVPQQQRQRFEKDFKRIS